MVFPDSTTWPSSPPSRLSAWCAVTRRRIFISLEMKHSSFVRWASPSRSCLARIWAQRTCRRRFANVSGGPALHLPAFIGKFYIFELELCDRALVCVKDTTYTAVSGSIVVWERCRQVTGWIAHDTSIKRLLLIGDTLITASESQIRTWDLSAVKRGEEAVPTTSIDLPDDFSLTTIIHPPTYMNKIVIGSESGQLAVWNINTCKVKYTSRVFEGSGVTALESSPAIDIIAVGLANGNVSLHNIKTDKVRERVVTLRYCHGLMSWIAVCRHSSRLHTATVMRAQRQAV